jgi:transposase-like protein
MRETAMSKNRTKSLKSQEALEEKRAATVQLPMPLLSVLSQSREALMGLCITTGLQVFEEMLEADREALCGPRRAHDEGPQRYGFTPSEVTLGGRRVPIRRPRVRGEREIELPSFAWAADRDPLDEATWQSVVRGVTTRGYSGLQPELPEGLSSRSDSRSAISRRFVALSQRKLEECLSRPLSNLELSVVMLDGIAFEERMVLVALGIASDGRKHVLGLREGTTENAGVVSALLRDLIERGLPSDRRLLFVIDGAIALRKALQEIFGNLAVVQRCQIHKLRNVLEHLPEALRPRIRKAIEDAYRLENAELAKRRLEQLAKGLAKQHPSAAASLREGLDETLTLQRLGIRGTLWKSLRSTNPIENLNGAIARFTRNVKRWLGGSMILRWVGSAVLEAEQRFRRVKGYQQMRELIRALQKPSSLTPLTSKKKAA